MPGCRVEAITPDGPDRLQVAAHGIRPGGRCPDCGRASRAVHSRYRRHPSDLPSLGRRVNIGLHVRRFYCRNARCARRTFAERLPELAAPYARRTCRLSEVQSRVGVAVGGEVGARLLRDLAIAEGDPPDGVDRRRRSTAAERVEGASTPAPRASRPACRLRTASPSFPPGDRLRRWAGSEHPRPLPAPPGTAGGRLRRPCLRRIAARWPKVARTARHCGASCVAGAFRAATNRSTAGWPSGGRPRPSSGGAPEGRTTMPGPRHARKNRPCPRRGNVLSPGDRCAMVSVGDAGACPRVTRRT